MRSGWIVFLAMLSAAPGWARPQEKTQAASAPAAATASPAAQNSIATKTAGMQKFDGFFPFYWDAHTGKIWLQIDKWNAEFLYLDTLANGMGQNDVGLDRGQRGEGRVVKFQRVGPKVLLIQSNYEYRATSDNAYERRSVEESFPVSAIWGFDVSAEEGDAVLVDATSFFMHDAHEVIERLRGSQQGSFSLDANRSAIYLPRTKNFPKNTEVEAILTFKGDDPGPLVREVTPEPTAMTLHEHYSFVELPGPGYTPRAYDPRASFFGVSFMDLAVPVDQPVERRFIARHRLQKKDPSAAVSEPVEPIQYYVDRATPEPIRSALVEGARWWNQAFTAAGYKDAFRVDVLPDGADTMDIRYNVIQWVHRGERGWSNGEAIVDPRTGEIIQGIVTLGSLRARQDYLIAEGLTAPYADGKTASPELMKMVVARMRQLSAHEVGHTLGLEHNFAASSVNRASVMDYPPPVVTIGGDGSPDLTGAYATGIGEWDKVSIAYGYQDFPQGTEETAALNKILNDAFSGGQRFLTDQDARPAFAASPYAHLWDAGSNAVDELNRIMKVRAAVLKRFGENNIRAGAPMATLEEVLVPVYMLHRYQVEAAAKVVGGVDYTFAVRGDALAPTKPVAAPEQRRALDAVLATLTPEALELPDSLLKLIPPRPPSYPHTRELFRGHTAPTFDALAPAEAAASHVVAFLLNAQRAERLVEYHAGDAKNPGFEEIVDRILAATWKGKADAGYAGEIERVVDQTVLYDLMALASDSSAATQPRAIAALKLDTLKSWFAQQAPHDEGWRAAYFYAAQQIKQFETNPKQFEQTKPATPPDGQPIGESNPWNEDGAWDEDAIWN
jgi:hypothetical protein